MKRFLFLALVIVALILPTAVFANSFTELNFGLGTSQFPNGQVSISVNGGPDIVIPYKPLGTSSFDFLLGATWYWSLNDTHSIWLGAGFTFSIPVTSSQNLQNTNFFTAPIILSADLPLIFDVNSFLSIVIKPSIFGVLLRDEAPIDVADFDSVTFAGFGAGLGVGPTFYFDDHQNIGISTLVGYRFFHSVDSTTAFGFLPVDLTYNNSGWYATVGMTILLGSSKN